MLNNELFAQLYVWINICHLSCLSVCLSPIFTLKIMTIISITFLKNYILLLLFLFTSALYTLGCGVRDKVFRRQLNFAHSVITILFIWIYPFLHMYMHVVLVCFGLFGAIFYFGPFIQKSCTRYHAVWAFEKNLCRNSCFTTTIL